MLDIQTASKRPKILAQILLAFLFFQTAQAQYIRDWLVVGGFPAKPDKASLSFEYFENEADLQAFGGQEMNEKKWILFHSPQNILDLRDPRLKLERTEQSVAYVQAFVYSPVPQTARLFVGSDDEIAIWCNRKKIHHNWVERVHHFGEDQIKLELDLGWNRLLFKIVNIAVAWQLSAQIVPETEVHFQAENPFSPVTEISTPGRISLWQTPEKLTPMITPQNEPVLRAPFVFFNPGTRKLKSAEINLSLERPVLPLEPIQEVAGGELREYWVTLPIVLLDSLILAASPIHFQFAHQSEAYSAIFPKFNSRELVTTVFSPWQLEGWRETRERNLTIYEKTWEVDKFFSGLRMNFQVDFRQQSGNLFIDGRRVLSQFQGYSGNYLLTNDARPFQKFNLRIEILPDSVNSNFNGMPFTATVQPDFPGIDVYLNSGEYAARIFGHTPPQSNNPDKEIYQQFRKNRIQDLSKMMKNLTDSLKTVPTRADSFTLNFVGNAHIDMAWLWRYPETIQVCETTFRDAIENMKKYPEFKFSHGQAHSYWWIENQNPELFKEIQKYVKSGQWEIVGGTWVEPDLNLSDGESQVRQFLYGKHYFKNKFNIDVKTGWMPDTFGHPATLPQILKKCGIESYTFFRPLPNEQFFTWRAPDGSAVLAHRPTRWFGSNQIDSDIWQGLWDEVDQFGYPEVLRFYGTGDHGGGPNRREIETLLALSKNPAYPKVVFGTMQEFYRKMMTDQQTNASDIPKLPEISAEQNFVFRGCWTTQARTKWNNRRAECFLPVAETFATLSTLFENLYPQTTLNETWQNLLFNQFHDILAGSSIGPVYEDAAQSYDLIFEKSNAVLSEALGVIATHINTQFSRSDALPLVVFNSLNWPRSAPLELTIQLLPGMRNIQLLDQDENLIPVQIIEQTADRLRFVFLAQNVPEMGYRTYWLNQIPKVPLPNPEDELFFLENNYLKVEIDEVTGAIKNLVSKTAKTCLIQDKGCELQLQADTPPDMAAWKLGLKGPITVLTRPRKIEVVESGAVRKVVRVEYVFQNSIFVQKYILYNELPRLDVQLTAEWKERNQMVKIAIPINLKQPQATFDIPFGAINRPTDGQEVPAQKWIDLSDDTGGVSLLNDCKYGFDVKGNTLRMSILRGATEPDSLADLGYHTLSYAIFPHRGSWKDAGTELEAYNFNYSLGYLFTQIHKGSLPSSSSFLKIEPQNVIVSALKQAENNKDWILRIFETHGQASEVQITLPQMAHAVYESDMLEWRQENLAPRGYEIKIPIAPYEIKTLRFSF
jgi:alpha-mannosidase